MQNPEIRRWTTSEIQAEADKFLFAYGKYDNRSLMIETVIEQYGIAILPIPGLAAIAEAYIPVKSGFIFVDEEQYLGAGGSRYRFSLAEELAHTLLHRSMFDRMSVQQILEFQKSLSDQQYEQIEREAKKMAGALLMREDWFRERFAHFLRSQEASPNNEAKKLRYAFRQLSWDFNVSIQSVMLRAVCLQIIDWSQYHDLREDD